jgi:DNA-binding NarL/FixJ family response regulator
MSKPTTIIVDALNNEVIERELREDELEQLAIDQAASLASKSLEEAKISARESALAKLAALGLTEDEIAAL